MGAAETREIVQFDSAPVGVPSGLERFNRRYPVRAPGSPRLRGT